MFVATTVATLKAGVRYRKRVNHTHSQNSGKIEIKHFGVSKKDLPAERDNI